MPKFLSSLLATALLSIGAVCHAAPGVTADSVLLGQSAALTGPNAEFGIEMRDGALAYFEEVNANGGVNGRKIVLKTLDDAYDPARTVANTKTLMDQDNVFALFGYVGTVPTLSVLPLIARSDIPYFGPHTGSELMRHPFNRNVFNVIAGYETEAEAIVEQMDAVGAKTVAVLYQNDPYGRSGLQATELALKKRGLKVMAVAMVEKNATDLSAAIATIRAAKPRAVVIAAGHTPSSAFILGMQKTGDSLPYFWSLSSVGTQLLVKDLGAAGRGVLISHVIPSPWDPVMPVVQEYKRLYIRPGRRLSYTGLQGFLVAKTFVEGLRHAGRDLTRASFTKGMESMHFYDLGGFVVKYSPTSHAGSDYVDLTVISTGGKLMY